MKIIVTVATGKVGSQTEEILEIDDADLAGLTAEDREKYIERQAQEVAFGMVEWNWVPVETDE